LKEAETIAPGSLPDSVNISLDALDPRRYRLITRHKENDPRKILSLIEKLLEKNIRVKLNCVPVRSFNEEEIIPLAALARDKEIAVRFIELMPLGSAAALQSLPAKEVEAALEESFGPLTPFTGVNGNGPAVYYSLPDFTGKIGFINAMTHGFCETCNRLRLTSEGFLKLCLSGDAGLDLRELLRAGAANSDISQEITEIIKKKPKSHTLSEVYSMFPKAHTEDMSAIGG
jgi:cyclic pyranopterin phosphate synthase